MAKKRFNSRYYNRTSLSITFVYMVMSALWIVFSDELLHSKDLINNPELVVVLSVAKGWFYTLVVGVFFYSTMTREFNRRLQLENSLSGSERLLLTLSEVYPDATLAIDKDKRVILWNKAMEEMTGIPASQMLGKNDHAYTIPFYGEARPQLMDLFWDPKDKVATKYPFLQKEGDNYVMETFAPALDNGKGRYIWAKASPLLDIDNNLIGAVECIRDVSDRKQTEDALKDGNELLTQYMSNSPIYTFIKEVTQKSSRVIKASSNYSAMLGEHGVDILGKTMEELFPADFAAKMTRDDWSVVASGKILKLDEDFNGRNYTTIKFPLKQGAKKLLAGYTIDITDRKQAEDELKKNKDILEQAEIIANIGHYELDILSGLWTSSPTLNKIMGIGDKYVRSVKGWSDLILPGDRVMMDGYFTEEVLGLHHPFDKEYRIIRQTDKVIRWVHGLGRLEFNSQDEPIKMIGTIRDITKHKELDLRLQKKNQALQMLNNANQAFLQFKDETRMLEEICRVIVDIGGYKLAWVGFAEVDKTKAIRPVAQAGLEDDYLKDSVFSWADSRLGHGPSGTAIRSGKPSIVKNILTDPAMAPWRKEAVKRGYQSLISLPLKDDNRVFGMLTIYSGERNAFGEEDLRILNEFAGDISLGVSKIRANMDNRKFQEALVFSESKYRSIFETAKDGILIISAKTGEIMEVNHYLIGLLGYGPEEYLRKKIWEVPILKAVVGSKDAFEEWKIKQYERYENFPLTVRTGAEIRVDIISNVAPGYREEVIQCNIRDVTEHYELGEKILQSEKRYSALVENSNDAVILVQDGLIKYANPATSLLTNLTPQEIVGKEMMDFVAPQFKDMVADNYERQVNGEIVETRYELAIIDKNKKNVPVETNNSAIIFEGRPAIIAIIRDVSRAKQIDRVKSEFISVASHQLRTPLTGIKWFGQLLLDQKVGKLSEKQIDFIQQMYDSNERMIRLVNDLLDVSHIETGHKFNFKKMSGDVIALLNGVIQDQLRNYPNRGMEIILEPGSPKKLVFDFDQDKVYQVFSNLLSNAIKYSGSSKSVVIGVNDKKNNIEFFVRDFGFGIPRHQQDRVFQKFFRAENILTKSTEGTGLGLYIAKSIVSAHGGKMWFESTEGQGATFYFSLPVKNNSK